MDEKELEKMADMVAEKVVKKMNEENKASAQIETMIVEMTKEAVRDE